jgi:hypothetical protein
MYVCSSQLDRFFEFCYVIGVYIFLFLADAAYPTHLVNAIYMPMSFPDPMFFLLCLCHIEESVQVRPGRCFRGN